MAERCQLLLCSRCCCHSECGTRPSRFCLAACPSRQIPALCLALESLAKLAEGWRVETENPEAEQDRSLETHMMFLLCCKLA